MYHILRAIQDNILRSPAFQPGDSIHFEDVLGRSKILPYEYFRYIEVFNSFLEAQFRGLPGERKVLQRQYLILHAKLGDEPISEEESDLPTIKPLTSA
ncbi:hypothetical protein BU23DRAFT_32573 [Bimuria novae-zelandiae CBS 107.79]|uniref:Ubiquitin-like domain-containing protein n=1 Tax=Bimuria novae-zelandiae CBS 107.79 TaxID=1447943 RepID=A0A6A5VP50_9PLEO|nr:hypothetical protein BU23DRAFT_32573 [Bimuria novae-zelandiae CBS 107.79]